MPCVYVKFPLTNPPLARYSDQRFSFHFLRVPCVGEIVDTRDAKWVVHRVVHHAGEDILPDATATIFVRLEE